MKFTLILLAVAVCSASAVQDSEWSLFKAQHKKFYSNIAEEVKRYNIYKSNMAYIAKHNEEFKQGKHTFYLGVNRFADMTNQEFVAMFNGYNGTLRSPQAKPALVFEASSNVQVPDSIDWRTQGYVTDVKDQGQCGSCWSFSATGSLEGQNFKKTGKLVSLSEQNLVDCSGKFGNQGCNGGLMDQAFQYIKANNGIDTEESYPYTAEDGTCQFNPANVGATDTGFVDVKSKDEEALKQAVGTVGPISVAIDASHVSFQLYKGGVYHELLCSQTRLDHGVLAVGYGTEDGKDYWLVKNSWAATWGDHGYIKMSRNRNNNCGIATSASYPTV